MDRRAFVGFVGALTLPLTAAARMRERRRRVAYLSPLRNDRLFSAFRAGLAQWGYVEGGNLLLHHQSVDGRVELLDQAAAELVRLSPDVIITIGGAATRSARTATHHVPIVFAPVGDALASGLVTSLSNPTGNITGLSIDTWILNGKRLEALTETFRGIRRVAVLANSSNPTGQTQWEITERGGRALGLELKLSAIRQPADLPSVLAEIARDKVDALHVLSDAVFDASREQIVTFAAVQRLPTIYEHRAFTEAGGLMSYGPNLDKISTRAAWYVAKILDGARPGELPVEQPTHFELVVNLKTAPRTVAPHAPTVVVLRDAWEKLGYREPGSVLLRSAEGHDARLAELAEELVAQGARVIIAVGPAAVRAASQVSATSVVAIDQETDPVRTGLAASFGRPGGNVTGLFVDQPGLAGKMTDLLKEAAPAIRRVAIVRTPQTTSDQLEAALGAARLRGLDVMTVDWGGREGYEAALAPLAGEPATGVVQLSTPGFTLDAKGFAEAAQKLRLPTIAFLKTYVRDGVLMSYGPRQETYFPRAVLIADRIMKGESPANIPIEQPTQFELAINARTAQSIKLEIPPTLLARADEVIE